MVELKLSTAELGRVFWKGQPSSFSALHPDVAAVSRVTQLSPLVLIALAGTKELYSSDHSMVGCLPAGVWT